MLNTIVGIAAGILLGAVFIGAVNWLINQGSFHVGIG